MNFLNKEPSWLVLWNASSLFSGTVPSFTGGNLGFNPVDKPSLKLSWVLIQIYHLGFVEINHADVPFRFPCPYHQFGRWCHYFLFSYTNTPASYSGGPGHKYRPGDRISWVFCGFSPGKCWDSTFKCRSRARPSSSFPIHHLLITPSFGAM
jgi:hypothetical protein